jgi:Protein of unknown function (DUF3618)
MTTSEREVRPAEQTADNTVPAPRSGASTQGETRGDTRETEPLTGSIASAPDDSRQLQLEIERTREQLGETVQELFARADVIARARAKANQVSGKYKSTVFQARNQAAHHAGRVRTQVTGNTTTAWQKATSANKAGQDQFRSRAVAVRAQTWEAMPKQVRRAITNGASGGRESWLALAIALGVASVGCLAARQLVMRSSSATR